MDDWKKTSKKIIELFGLHFQCIFSQYLRFEIVIDARQACCKVIPMKVNIANRDRLDVVSSMLEHLKALTSMNNGESPNIDGLHCELFKAMLRYCRRVPLLLVNEPFSSSTLTTSLNQGFIKLIPKNASRDTIGDGDPLLYSMSPTRF
jgi:hypothetical protein